jgi:hypothetical protein
MTGDRFTQIGLDRLVHLDWLEKVSTIALTGLPAKDIRTILQEDLLPAFRSNRTDVRGSLDKTVTILMKVWVTPPSELDSLRKEGLELLRILPESEHIAVHWGMVAAVYTFWLNVGAQVGRLLKLQGNASATQVQRRLREQYGERETVSRRARYVLRSCLEWGVIKESGRKGIYTAGKTLAVDDFRLIAWLIEAFLNTRATGSAPLKDLINSPGLFPFRIKPLHAEGLVAGSSRLEALRHGLDDDLVILRNF